MEVPEATKRILTDETGQDIVSALQALTNVVDPNGTTVATALKLNNMTTSIVPLAAGATPSSTLTTVDGHFHLTLNIPVELPVVTSENNGQIMKVENGVWTPGDPPATMTGATLNDNGASGLVPAPTTADVDKFLSGDGTYKSGGLPMVILSYGHSTWQEFMNAYRNNVIVYCRASSNANPATGSQTRMAFMAYVSDATNPTNVEFQYYRSMNPNNKTINQMSDQVYVYKLQSNGTWSVEVREASLKSVVFDASSGLTGTFDKTTGTLTIAAAT